MYKHNAKQLLLPHEFFMPFEGQLNPENRWCKLAAMIPWEIAEERYIMSKRVGQGSKRKFEYSC